MFKAELIVTTLCTVGWFNVQTSYSSAQKESIKELLILHSRKIENKINRLDRKGMKHFYLKSNK